MTIEKELEARNALRALKQRFRYMFNGPNLGFDFYRGWLPDFVEACEQIDALLTPDRIGFHFSQVKEKYGWARYYFDTDRANLMRMSIRDENGITEEIVGLKDEHDIERKIAAILSEAEQKSMTKCMACGAPAEIQKWNTVLLCVCDEHAREKRGDSVYYALIRD